MAEYTIAIRNRIASIEAGVELVCNNPTDSIRFEFDEEWSGIAVKTARFSWEGKYIDVPFSGNVVEVPEIFQTIYVYVGVFADNIATTPAKIKCRYSIKCLGGKVVAPTNDVYAEIIALINAGIDANDGVGVSSAIVDSTGHLIITLTTGESIDCGLVKGADGADGKDGENGKDGAGAEEYADMLAQLEEVKTDIADMQNFTEKPFEVSGEIVQFNHYQDAPLNVVSRIEPIQSGSGDPYPAGGGKNLLENTATTQTVNGVTFTINGDGSVKVNGTATATALLLVGKIALKANTTYVCGSGVTDVGFSLRTGNGAMVIHDFAASITYTPTEDVELEVCVRVGSGKTVSTTVYPQIEAGSIATEYAPYSNIRPISGRTGAELVRCRGNLVSYDYGGGTVQGVTVTKNEDGYYTLNGTPTASGIAILATLTLPPGTYTLSLDAASGSCSTTEQTAGQLVAADTNALLIAVRPNVLKSSCTLTERTKVWVRLFVNSATTYNNWKIRICLAAGADAASEPYQGDTYVLDFGQTVYGGTLDWNKGELVVDRKVVEIDGSTDISIPTFLTPIDGYTKFNTGVGTADALLPDDSGTPDAVCNMFPVTRISGTITGTTATGSCIAASSGSGCWYIMTQNSIASTVDELKTFLAGTPVQICYKLATPITIQLTPQQITALAGVNTVYGDGEITVSGRKDIIWLTHTLVERIAALEASIASLTSEA